MSAGNAPAVFSFALTNSAVWWQIYFSPNAWLKQIPQEVGVANSILFFNGGDNFVFYRIKMDGSSNGDSSTQKAGGGITFGNFHLPNILLVGGVLKDMKSDGFYYGQEGASQNANIRIISNQFLNCARQGSATVACIGVSIIGNYYKDCRLNCEGSDFDDGALSKLRIVNNIVNYSPRNPNDRAVTINGVGENGTSEDWYIENLIVIGDKIRVWSGRSGIDNITFKDVLIKDAQVGWDLEESEFGGFTNINFENMMFENVDDEGNWEDFA